MSKIALEGNSLGSGTFTIAAPNSNSNPTLTLPTSSGTVVVTGGAQTIEFAAGSAAAPSITFTGDTNTGIFSPAADTIAFAEGGAEAMRIDSDGDVGIGTSSPAFKLDISGGGTTAKINTLDTHDGGASLSTWMKVGRRAGTGTNAYINTLHSGSDAVSALTWAFGTSGTGTEVMRIDSSGNVGIGTSSPEEKLSLNGTYRTATSQPWMVEINNTASQATGYGGGIAFGGKYDSSNITYFANITGAKENSTSGDVAGYLAFYSRASGAGNNAERARITSGGDFCIGNTAAINSARLTAKKGSARDVIAVFTNTDENYGRIQFADANYFVGGGAYGADWTAGSGVSMSFVVNQSATPATASLSTTGVWTNASDIRYKENVVPIPYGLAEIMQLKPSSYNMIGSDKKQIGLIAQDILPIIPEVVESVYCEPLDEDRYTLSYGNLVAVCIKAIQELKSITDAQATRIEALEAEVAALKGQ